jgi:hypothetical protein
MTSFNDLTNTELFKNETRTVDSDSKDDYTNIFTNISSLEPLFTVDETIDIEQLPFEGIHYLDCKNTYSQKLQKGKYTLKQHQTTTLYYMLSLEKMIYNVKTIKNSTDFIYTNHYTNIGVLSDQVGAGKSYCIMALLNEIKTLNSTYLPFRKFDFGSSNITPKIIKKLDTNILLVPHSLIGQWSKYLENSGLKYHVVQKAKDVYGLGDKNCKFNNNNNNNDSNSNSNSNDNSKIDDTNSKTKTTKRKSVSKKTPVSKKISIDESVITDIKDDNVTVPKKKIVLKKKSSLVEPAVVTPEPAVVTPEPAVVTPEIKSKKQLENEKIEIQREIRNIESILSELRHSLGRYYHTNHRHYQYPIPTEQIIGNSNYAIQTDRTLIQEQIDQSNELLNEKYKKYSELNESIKNYTLLNGTVSDGQIQLLHSYINICNDPATFASASNYIDKTLKDYMDNISHINKEYVESLDVILVSDTFYNLFTLYINRDDYTVNRIIIDECNSVKGSNLIQINNIFTWLITSSINSVMTSTGYIIKKEHNNNIHQGYSYNVREKTIMSTGFILNTIVRLFEYKDNHKLFLINNPEYIKQSISLPELKTYVIMCKDNVVIQVLNGIVSNDIMRMLNAGDIEGIISKIDAVVGDESNIISIITQKYTDDLLIKEYELKVAIENPKYKPETESLSISNKRIAIHDLKYKIACIEDRVKNADSCPICIDDFINPIITPCCNNKYCFNCITLALHNKTTCPSCRNNLSISKLLILSDKSKDSSQNTIVNLPINLSTYLQKVDHFKSISNNSSKYDNMDKIFELNSENPIKKYLIFTEYESTLNTKITSILDKWNLKYDRIRGSSSTINKQLEKYKNPNGETNVLLVNSKFFGSGMNLENTSDIIIMHKMQGDIEMQAIGRAQRFGREGELRVWKLYYQNESR